MKHMVGVSDAETVIGLEKVAFNSAETIHKNVRYVPNVKRLQAYLDNLNIEQCLFGSAINIRSIFSMKGHWTHYICQLILRNGNHFSFFHPMELI